MAKFVSPSAMLAIKISLIGGKIAGSQRCKMQGGEREIRFF
jgi:hypothetical protein